MEKKNDKIIYLRLYELDGSLLDAESYRRHTVLRQTKEEKACPVSSGASDSFGSLTGSGFSGGYGLHLI